MKLDVVFVAQQGELEAMAAVLAASLRKFCENQVFLHVIEPIPEQEYGRISPETRRFLDDLGVQWYAFTNPISDEYKIFNKLNAFKIQPQGERILFLDSDILIRRSITPLQPYFTHAFAARTAGAQRYSARVRDWEPVYRLFNLEVPRVRWPAWGTYEWGPPYFNAGVILVDPELDFSTHWIDTCYQIHYASTVHLENPGTVQVGLPVVLYRQNIEFALLDGRFNFALNKWWGKLMKRHWVDDEAFIVHYFNPKNICDDQVMLYETGQLIEEFQLGEVLQFSPRWQGLIEAYDQLRSQNFHPLPHELESSMLRPADKAASAPGHETSLRKGLSTQPLQKEKSQTMVFLTSIPCSGEDQFLNLLSYLPAIKILREPDLQGLFTSPMDVTQFRQKWQQWRREASRNISEPAPKTPGFSTGAGAQALAENDNDVDLRDAFILATQNTTTYLTHLGTILNNFPEAKIFILVRNPFDTLACWKQQSSWDEAEFIDGDAQAGLNAPGISKYQQVKLASLNQLKDPAIRRAGLWDYFAGLANFHHPNVHIIRFEDLANSPTQMLRLIQQKLWGPGSVEVDISHLPSVAQPEPVRQLLDAWEKECIRVICTNSAGAFDYNLYED